jgi:hypothetical protein
MKKKQLGSFYFDMLSLEEQAKYAENAINNDKNMSKILGKKYFNFLHFISTPFDWVKTPEGVDYWLNISCSQRDGVDPSKSLFNSLGYESEEDYLADVVMGHLIDKLGPIISEIIEPSKSKGFEGKKLFARLDKDAQDELKKEFKVQRKDSFDMFLKLKFYSLTDMLQCSLSFAESEKGMEYWVDMCEKYAEDAEEDELEEILSKLKITKQE